VVTRRDLLIGAGAAVGWSALSGVTPGIARAAAARLSVVLVLTDDMRFDYRQMLGVFKTGPWIDCTGAAAQTPMCSPSRSSLLTSTYAWQTPVVSNPTAPNFPQVENATFVPLLKAAGYRTALVGKYMNQYPWNLGADHVPPGWTDWAAVQSSGWRKPGTMHETDYNFTWASNFVKSLPVGQPFYLQVNPKLPHDPFMPPTRYAATPVTPPAEPPSFNEADVSDKPRFVQNTARLTTAEVAGLRQDRVLIGRDMLAINDGMNQLIAALRAVGRLGSTVIIFTSDNSLELGEHRLVNKGYPYEESVRLPFLVRYPGVARRTEPRPLSLVDLGPTVCAIAGAGAFGQHGVNLVPLFTSSTRVRDGAYLTPPDKFTWEGVRHQRYKYVEYTDGFRELYDLRVDPFELRNIAGTSGAVDAQSRMRTLLQKLRP
jgi:arylsulfatase A-like enzyme